MQLTKNIKIGLIIVIAVVAMSFLFSWVRTERVQGSVSVTDEYMSTTTGISRFPTTGYDLLNASPGTLGQIVVTGTASGQLNIYDATTSDVTRRTFNTSTTSIWVVNLPGQTATGTYTFDSRFNYGMLVIPVGNMPTTTIMFRR